MRLALAACHDGDTLVVTKLDRLARSLPVGSRDVFGFPATMAAGDFDADGRDDLTLASIGGPDFDTAGSITILYGSASGLTGARVQVWSQGSVGIAHTPGDFEWFGQALTAGNFGRDSGGRRYPDLAVLVGLDLPRAVSLTPVAALHSEPRRAPHPDLQRQC